MPYALELYSSGDYHVFEDYDEMQEFIQTQIWDEDFIIIPLNS